MSIPIPVGPVPIVLADFFVMLTGLFMGWKYGVLSVGLYLGLGVLGLPVFSGGSSGFAAIWGPTGGFLIGYLLLAATIGFITSKGKSWFITDLIGILLGNAFLYALGITWLKIRLEMSWPAAVTTGLVPFIPGTIIKIVVALAISRMLVPGFKENLGK